MNNFVKDVKIQNYVAISNNILRLILKKHIKKIIDCK